LAYSRHIDLFGPVGTNGGWQARAGQGFDLSHFQIDWNKRKVSCPQGKQSRSWKKGKDSYGNPIIHVEFRQNECKNCPVRSLCTRAPIHARGITLLPQLVLLLINLTIYMATVKTEIDKFCQQLFFLTTEECLCAKKIFRLLT
jgi:Transposase DDE domain